MERLGVLIWIFVVGFVLGSEKINKKPEIYSMTIYTDIKYRFATTKVTSRVTNPGDTVRESLFDVTLPNEAFITNLTLEIDDKIVLGEIKEKQKAKQQYEAARSRGESAGHIETKHRETNRFTLSISVAPMSKVTLNLTYQELLKRTHGYYEEVIYIDPGQPVPELEVTVTILESRNITKLSVPVESNQVHGEFLGASSAAISQTSPTSAIVKYAPTLEQQKTERESGLSGKFVVRYDVDRSMDAGDVMMVNGYFVHFFAPEGFKPIPSDVLFILDTSASMYRQKMEQLKEAMLAILADMHEGDRMNILTFSGNCKLWRQEMVDIFDEDIRAEIEEFIGLIRSSGSTNIELAIRTGLDFMAALPEDKHRSRVIVFLTDGEATSGIVNDQDILRSIQRTNSEARIPIFTLSFGQSADYDIVKRIAVQNNGFGRKIYEASDATMQIAGFYSEISVTLLNNITFNYLDVEEVTQTQFSKYFNGSEIIVCGAYRPLDLNDSHIKDVEPKSLNLRVEGISVEGPSVLLVVDEIDMDQDVPENLTSAGDFEQITEKVWAYLTIKQLLDKQLTSDNDTVKEEITARVLDLSLQYGFVTPLTSMVVTLPVSSQAGQNGDEAAEVLEEFTLMDSSMAIHGKSLSGSSSGGRPFTRPIMARNYYGSNFGLVFNRFPPSFGDSWFRPVHRYGVYHSLDSWFRPVHRYGVYHSLGLPPRIPVKSLPPRIPVKSLPPRIQVKTVSTPLPVTTVLAPLPLKPAPLPLTIVIPPKKRKYCFSLNVLPTANGNKTYRLFHDQDVAIHLMVSQSSKSSSDSNVTEVRVLANGMLKDVLTPQNDTDDMLDQQTNNCSIRIKKSNHIGLAIKAICSRDIIADGGIIDTLASKLIKVNIKVDRKKMHASVKLTDETFLLMKHKADGQKCSKFDPKPIIDLNDFLV